MNEILPIKIRLLAAWCHLSGLAWVAGFYLCYYNQEKSYAASEEFNRIFAAAMMLFLVPFLSWRFTKRIHDFIDRSGQKLFNYHISIIIYLLVLLCIFVFSCFVTLASGGLSAPSPNSTDTHPILSGLLWLSTNPHAIILIYAINIGVATVYTWRGKIFSYPLAINFIESPLHRSTDDED